MQPPTQVMCNASDLANLNTNSCKNFNTRYQYSILQFCHFNDIVLTSWSTLCKGEFPQNCEFCHENIAIIFWHNVCRTEIFHKCEVDQSLEQLHRFANFFNRLQILKSNLPPIHISVLELVLQLPFNGISK